MIFYSSSLQEEFEFVQLTMWSKRPTNKRLSLISFSSCIRKIRSSIHSMFQETGSSMKRKTCWLWSWSNLLKLCPKYGITINVFVYLTCVKCVEMNMPQATVNILCIMMRHPYWHTCAERHRFRFCRLCIDYSVHAMMRYRITARWYRDRSCVLKYFIGLLTKWRFRAYIKVLFLDYLYFYSNKFSGKA